ncbi:MAG: acyl-CoA desaturase [Planctomycetota bacterium]
MTQLISSLARWFDGSVALDDVPAEQRDRIEWLRCVPFILLHLAVLAVFWVGVSWVAVGVGVALYAVRMFAVTGFYHRYFSHRTFKTSRWFQFLMALAGSSAVQRGPIWWAAHHRYHHVHSDDHPDHHSPGLKGLWMSHVGWFMTRAGFATDRRYVRDWLRYPELRFLDRFDWLVPLVLAASLYGGGELLARFAPALGTNGLQMFFWGFVCSTLVLYHATYTINSLAHSWGRQRFETDDDSRNNFWLALLTLGEGWHNNHHHYPASVRQGFYWWEIDLTYYALKALSWTGLIWQLRGVPAHVLTEGRGGGETP